MTIPGLLIVENPLLWPPPFTTNGLLVCVAYETYK